MSSKFDLYSTHTVPVLEVLNTGTESETTVLYIIEVKGF
jgi:hypothetical protein